MAFTDPHILLLCLFLALRHGACTCGQGNFNRMVRVEACGMHVQDSIPGLGLGTAPRQLFDGVNNDAFLPLGRLI